MRRLPSLLLVLLVLSSGCAGFLPWSDSGSTRDAPTTTSTASLSPPPGANGQWIFDAERLISAHESALESENYRVNVRIRPKQDVGSARWMNSTLVAHVGDGRVRIRESGDGVVMNEIGNPYRGYAWNDSEAWCLHRCRHVPIPLRRDDSQSTPTTYRVRRSTDAKHPFQRGLPRERNDGSQRNSSCIATRPRGPRRLRTSRRFPRPFWWTNEASFTTSPERFKRPEHAPRRSSSAIGTSWFRTHPRPRNGWMAALD